MKFKEIIAAVQLYLLIWVYFSGAFGTFLWLQTNVPNQEVKNLFMSLGMWPGIVVIQVLGH